jgi:hypothetical protein
MAEQEEAACTSAYVALDHSQPLIFFRPAELTDLDAVAALEEASYPADEAATRAKLELRLQQASNAFLVAIGPSSTEQQQDSENELRIVGFVCGTCAHGDTLTHASMAQHEPEGRLLCIHSVVVDGALRRRGIATRMLKASWGVCGTPVLYPAQCLHVADHIVTQQRDDGVWTACVCVCATEYAGISGVCASFHASCGKCAPDVQAKHGAALPRARFAVYALAP